MNKINKFVLFLVFLCLCGLPPGGAYAGRSANELREVVNGVAKKLSTSLVDSLLKKDAGAVQSILDRFVSDAEERGKPIKFGIGVLNREGLAIAGKYVIGTFKKDENFSNYNYVLKAFKQKKIISDRLFFQDKSEILIVCVPQVHQREAIGALVLGFNPSEVMKDYGLTAEKFLALKFN